MRKIISARFISKIFDFNFEKKRLTISQPLIFKFWLFYLKSV